MNEQLFYEAIYKKSKEYHINPLLLLSGVEGLYTFKDVPLNTINYELLDSLILTIFTLRIGDKFHSLAEEQLQSENFEVNAAAQKELDELTHAYISDSGNAYLQSFAQVLNGKSPVRKYHEKALEVAAIEIKKLQLFFNNESIGMITIAICKDDENNSLGLGSLFRN